MPAIQISGRFKTCQSREVSFFYPEEWDVTKGEDESLTITGANGMAGESIGYGLLVSHVFARNGDRIQLVSDTAAYLKGLASSSPNVKTDTGPAELTVAGSAALLTRLSSDSPYQAQRERDMVITIDRGAEMLVLVFVAPSAQFEVLEPNFKKIIESLRFSS
jgi:hypothetical protein